MSYAEVGTLRSAYSAALAFLQVPAGMRLRLTRVREELIPAQVAPLLDWLGLGEVLERHPPELAPPHRQLLALARAAVGAPDLLLADEPLAGLDSSQAGRAMRLLFSLQRRGAAVVLATRDEGLHRRYGMPALRLCRGRLLAPTAIALAPTG